MKLLILVVFVFAILMIGSLNKDLYKNCVTEKQTKCYILNTDCHQDAKENCELEYF